MPQQWVGPIVALFLVLLISIASFFDTWASIVDIWIRSKTFNHGFVVAPISLWLIWTRRDLYRNLYPEFSLFALAPLLLGGLLWLVADLSHVLVVKQFAVVAMLVSGLWGVLGNQVTFNMLFPLAFLFFMVPFGEEFVPYLMDFTATFTVRLLRLTGLTVYREGNFFTLTSGNWSVVEACSGINYLIASITLGFVYAYLNYTRYWKRALFIGLSCVVPIIANGFRAYLIVMIGHLSDMELAVGVDHLIYGGIFFGFVTLLLFYLGSFWRDPLSDAKIVTPNTGIKSYLPLQAVPVLLVIGAGFIGWPIASNWLQAKHPDNGLPDYVLTAMPGDWQKTSDPGWSWQPELKGAAVQHTDFFNNGKATVGIYHAGFGKETQGRELVNSQNLLIASTSNSWRMIYSGTQILPVPKRPDVNVVETLLSSEVQDLLVFEWYQVGSQLTANTYKAKIYQLVKRLSADSAPELKVIIWTDTDHLDQATARNALQDFSTSWLGQQRYKPD